MLRLTALVWMAVLVAAATLAAQEKDEPKNSAEGKFWGQLTPEESEEAVAELKAFAESAHKTLGARKMIAVETDYFLFVTDIDPREARNWVKLLDKMYDRLCEMFDIPKGTNIWHGKALVFVFKSLEHFVAYERQVEQYNGPLNGVAGLCHAHGPIVRIAFHRQPDDMVFASVLVHESVHGFLHRYRKPTPLPSWVNEGLAEWITYQKELVPRSPMKPRRIEDARRRLSELGHTGGMFEADPIEGWQYGVAYTLTDYMITQDPRRYVRFINALKDGKDHRVALDEDFGAPRSRLVGLYGQAMRLSKPLQP